MSVFEIVFVITACIAAVGVVRSIRSEREFRRGYRLAIDHIEQMTRPGFVSYELEEAIAKLREETRR